MKKRCVYEPVFLRLRPNPTIEGSLADPRKKPVLESMRTGSLPEEYDVTFVERACTIPELTEKERNNEQLYAR